MNRFVASLPFAAIALGSTALAQNFNIDLGDNITYALPAATFGGAAGQPGTWNNVQGTTGVTPLMDVNGIAGPVTITCTSPSGFPYNFYWNNPATTGDDEKLMDDASDPSPSATWTISGLTPGNYILYTYAWAPDDPTYISNIHVAGSSDPDQFVGGAWPGGYVQGVTHAVHHITVGAGGSLGMDIAIGTFFATLNGFQIKFDSAAVAFCDPGVAGVLACPCSNPPAGALRGCENSSATGGASITASGSASLATDTLSFATTNEKPTATSIVLQGTVGNSGTAFGQGVRCVAGTLKRLYVLVASGGSITAPPVGGPTVSAKSASLGDTILPTQHRYYMVYYRDPIILGGCTGPVTFNGTNALDVTWN